jgi:ligand-binding sensor domain-containing protein/two-component sensor histidine kinase
MRMGHRSSAILLALLLFVVFNACGQFNNYTFQHLTVDDGLSQGVVQEIFQDSRGFLWFGTQDGLNRYDGFDFRIFKHDPTDSSSISNNFVRSICEDHSGNLWIATPDGLNKFNLQTESFIRYTSKVNDSTTIGGNNIFTVFTDKSGTVWIGTVGSGLNRYDAIGNTFVRINERENNNAAINTKSVSAISEDASGRLWLGVIGGIAEYDKKNETFRYFPVLDVKYEKQQNIIYTIAEGENGVFWLGTSRGGMVRLNTMNSTYFRYINEPDNPKSISSNLIWSISIEKGKRFLVATENGLNLFSEQSGEFRRILNDPQNSKSLSSNNIMSICRDRGGIYWLGTFGNGINKLNPGSTKFPHFKSSIHGPANLSNNNIWCFFEDSRGSLWIGTECGLNLNDPNGALVNIFKHDPKVQTSVSDDIITAITEDRNNYIWIGTRGRGLNRYDYKSGTFSHYLENLSILSLYTDSDTTLWVGTTTDGLFRFNVETGSYRIYKYAKSNSTGISNNVVGIIFRDQNGILWCGTYGGGLNKFDSKNELFTAYVNDPKDLHSLSNDIVTSIYQDSTGMMWIGTAQGLNMFNPIDESFTRLYEKDGLPNDFIYSILPDRSGNLWMSTNRGISRFNYDLHRRTGNGFKNFDVKDGLQGSEFNAGAFYKCRDGELFFGGPNGYNRFFPEEIPTNHHIPPVVLTSFKAMDKVLHISVLPDSAEFVELSYQDYFFTIGFAALDYSEPSKNRYEYQLEGFDDAWLPVGISHTARYTNIDPGEYRFKVRGSNDDGVWNPSGTSIRLIIHPPFWRTWWFYTLVSLMMLLSGYAVYKFRVNKLLEMERLRIRLASDLHDELASNLSSISMFSNLILNKSPDAEQFLKRISVLSVESVESIRDIIWAIDPKPETIETLLTRLRDTSVVHCNAKNIRLHFSVHAHDHEFSKTLTPEQRKNIWLLLKEAVNNSCKHSNCSNIHLTAEYIDGKFRITLKDDGVGFDTTIMREGKGLKTMRMRAEQLQGEFIIDSSPDIGTSIQIFLNTGK